jgi:hypothetical protein
MAKRFHEQMLRTAQTRALIADLAARFIAEHGIRDYGLAKRKAARQLGLPEGHGLPSNEEIDQALVERQNLYEPAEQTERLAALRDEALEVMQVFERFQPLLMMVRLPGKDQRHAHSAYRPQLNIKQLHKLIQADAEGG